MFCGIDNILHNIFTFKLNMRNILYNNVIPNEYSHANINYENIPYNIVNRAEHCHGYEECYV